MIEEEKWAAPSMTYFRPHFMVSNITKTIVIKVIVIMIFMVRNITKTIVVKVIVIMIRCLLLVMAMPEHTIRRQL